MSTENPLLESPDLRIWNLPSASAPISYFPLVLSGVAAVLAVAVLFNSEVKVSFLEKELTGA
jgi:hypothetical protein